MRSIAIDTQATVTDAMGQTHTATVVATGLPRNQVRIRFGTAAAEQWVTMPASQFAPVMNFEA